MEENGTLNRLGQPYAFELHSLLCSVSEGPLCQCALCSFCCQFAAYSSICSGIKLRLIIGMARLWAPAYSPPSWAAPWSSTHMTCSAAAAIAVRVSWLLGGNGEGDHQAQRPECTFFQTMGTRQAVVMHPQTLEDACFVEPCCLCTMPAAFGVEEGRDKRYVLYRHW
eukprot:scaffold24854_cov21-Tisochrysis_lutea.AAC.1